MSAWLTERVGSWGAPRATPQRATRSVDEVSGELEAQARRVNGPQIAAELLLRWVDRCAEAGEQFSIGAQGGAEPLSFYQVLLKCNAFEVLLDSCVRAPALRSAVLRGGPLVEALQVASERVLLPGTSILWPSLLEVLVASNDPSSVCAQWARRALKLLKRQWQHEALPTLVHRADQELVASMCVKSSGGSASSSLAPGANGPPVSRKSIRQALAKDQLRHCELEAGQLHLRTHVLCELCGRLEAAELGGASSLPEVERLVGHANDMLQELDVTVKALHEEQQTLDKAREDVLATLDLQIKDAEQTSESLTKKRQDLDEERRRLVRRLEELDLQLQQATDTESSTHLEAERLRGQHREVGQHFQERIATSFCRQKILADEKIQAATCKACALTALELVRGEEKRRGADLASQLRKRRAELSRSAASYVDMECQRLVQMGELELRKEVEDVLSSALVLARRAQSLLLAEAAPEDESCDEEGDAVSFFAEQRGRGELICVDCGSLDARWASVSFGAYLCMDCAGLHRGLGVHISFVRSVDMDTWTTKQLKRMQLGGSALFNEVMQEHPEGRPEAGFAIRYGSAAAAGYRQALDARCLAEAEPPPTEPGDAPGRDAPSAPALARPLQQELARLELQGQLSRAPA